MPEYLSPGVYIEETSFRAKSIQGVATSTAGFVGACRFGPTEGAPPLITSFEEFRRMFGGLDDLVLGGVPVSNYLAQGVKSFFDNGGQRVYIARLFKPRSDTDLGISRSRALLKSGDLSAVDGNVAPVGSTAFMTGGVRLSPRFVARSPGAEGNLPVKISAVRGGNAFAGGKLRGLKHGDVVEVTAAGGGTEPAPKDRAIPPTGTTLPGGGADPNVLTAANVYWVKINDLGQPELFKTGDGSGAAHALGTLDAVQRVTVNIDVGNPGSRVDAYTGISTHPVSSSYLATVLRDDNPPEASSRTYFTYGMNGTTPLELDSDDFADLLARLIDWGASTTDAPRLDGGNDGAEPDSLTYIGGGTDNEATGLAALAEVEDIAIIAAPGSSALGTSTVRQAVRNALISHCEKKNAFRFAILSAENGLDEARIRDVRSQHDTTYAALYYPWITIPDPFSTTGQTLDLPPDGSIAGVFARTDIERGVHKAPANEVVRDALRFSRKVTTGAQDTLNPEGINCLRSFEGRGNRVWGARTMSSDPEWTYINVRRLFIYLEHSIEKNTKWVVFEPNNESLWLKVRLTIESFLLDVWRTGALMGTKPQEAYFVRCDRSTMTQGDLDNGRLVVLIGVAPTKPAEFVIFRIGQWTADASIV